MSMDDKTEEIYGIFPAYIRDTLELILAELKERVPANTPLDFLIFVNSFGKIRFTIPMPDAATVPEPETLIGKC